MKSGGLGYTKEHIQGIHIDKQHTNLGLDSKHPLRNKALQDTDNDPSRNTFILLDSDEEDDIEQYQANTNSRNDDVDMFSFGIETELSPIRNTDVRPPPSMSPAVHILSSPSPSPTTTRLQDDPQPLMDTSWLSPPSPTNYDIDFLSSPSSSSNKPSMGKNITSSSPYQFTSNINHFLSLSPPNLFDEPPPSSSSLDFDTPLILSDNDSVDSLPSPSKLFSQMSNSSNSTTKRRTDKGSSQYTSTSTSISSNTGRKGKGKQTDTTYTSTKLAERTFISDRLWEWDNGDDDNGVRSTSLFDDVGSTSLFDDDGGSTSLTVDDSCNDSQETSQLSKKEAKKLQKQKEQEAKKRAREEMLLRKEQEKEQAKQLKEQEKQLQQVNRLRKNRDELIKEMMVVVRDRSFMESEHGQLLRAVLLEKDAKIISQPTTTTTTTTSSSYTLTWKRDYKADWDEERQQFVPFANGQIKSKEERAALVFMTAEAFVDTIHQDRVDAWIDSIQQHSRDKQLFLMVEGLEPFYRKKMNWRRRQFTSTVMGNMNEDSSSSSSGGSNSNTNSNTNASDDDGGAGTTRPRKRKKKTTSSTATTLLMENGPSRDTIEETLTYLQVVKDVMLIQTLNEEDSIDWLVCLTTDLAKALYNDINTAALCKGQGGGPRSGADAEDVWSKMLQEIQNCTPAVAKSIVDEYPNPMALYQQYTQMNSSNARDYLLADLEVQRSVLSNRDRTVNKFMSAKIHKIFMAGDPTDIIQ